ncbi:C-type lectin domain family 10 member A [Carassius auratus]|uniref:C-type lectin domain family 10 member A n=1 Tax=Carassius auratus TaxID=7957 RepID=A0A6P6N6A1_CARAU|nr:C-type lectin domain family 10 member A-like [Carassius auratus]
MCKGNSTGSDSVRIRRYKKATVYLVLQCVLLLEAIILLITEHRTKSNKFENSEEDFNKTKMKLLSDIHDMLNEKVKFENEIKEIIPKNLQLTEGNKLLSKHLREMDGWRCYQSNLYYISSEEKNWSESKQDCSKRGANLTIINSNEEQDFFKTHDDVWIGLNNMEGTWKWVDGSPLTLSFWASREPDGAKECVVTSKSPEKSEWKTPPCSSTFKWTCEREPSNKIKNLVIDFVKKISANANVWIGLTDSEVEGRWKWVDGSTLTSGFWDPREPNGHRGENCALTYSPGWADYACSDLFQWICEKSILK